MLFSGTKHPSKPLNMDCETTEWWLCENFHGGEEKTVKEKGPFDDDWQLMTELSVLS